MCTHAPVGARCRCLGSGRHTHNGGGQGRQQGLGPLTAGVLVLGVLSCFPFVYAAVGAGNGSQASSRHAHCWRGLLQVSMMV